MLPVLRLLCCRCVTEGQWEKKKIAGKDRDKIRERERRGQDAFARLCKPHPANGCSQRRLLAELCEAPSQWPAAPKPTCVAVKDALRGISVPH